VIVEADARSAIERDVLVLPGVGAFGHAAAALAASRAAITDAIHRGLPCFGICLGMQLLCDASDEGAGEGLGVFRGRVTALNARRVPQMGWNSLDDVRDATLEQSGLRSAYYANGFACRVDAEHVVAWSTHETDRFPAVVRRGRVMGVQFHPEKSSSRGVAFARAVLEDLCR
jgi:glutamine amidotransferase